MLPRLTVISEAHTPCPHPVVEKIPEMNATMPWYCGINTDISTYEPVTFVAHGSYHSPLPVAVPQSMTLSTFQSGPNLTFTWFKTEYMAE